MGQRYSESQLRSVLRQLVATEALGVDAQAYNTLYLTDASRAILKGTHSVTLRHSHERASERKSLVGSGDRSERIRTYNFPQGRVTDHRINLTLYNLARIISGDELGEIVDALVAQDQADRLAEFEAADN